MSEPTPKQLAAKKLIFAAFMEGLAVIAGLIAYFLTANWVWLAIGILGGLGFTLPAIITFVRASMEERNRASR
jgi:F0F1-type ATP synthase assembly protein I